jgi:hypothetical protein
MAMFTNRTTAALFTIAIASSLIVASGFVGSAFAAKKANQKPDDDMYRTLSDGQDKAASPKSHSASTGDSDRSVGDTSLLSSKELKKLSKCQSDAAADGDLTLGEVKVCYGQVSDQGQGQKQGQGK